MNEDNNPQPPIDYLNQISSKPVRKMGFLPRKPIMLAIIGASILVIILAAVSLFSSNTQPTQQLAARLITTSKLAETASSNIKSSQLRALNGSLKTYLNNTISGIEPILLAEGVKIKSIDKKITAAEASQETINKLEDARLNAIYDRTYSREMAYKLETILALMDQISKKNNSSSLKSFLDSAHTNLVPIQAELASFNKTN